LAFRRVGCAWGEGRLAWAESEGEKPDREQERGARRPVGAGALQAGVGLGEILLTPRPPGIELPSQDWALTGEPGATGARLRADPIQPPPEVAFSNDQDGMLLAAPPREGAEHGMGLGQPGPLALGRERIDRGIVAERALRAW
jgi:hypothetical protein